jgi:pyruvate dehydrogenase E2 component (dihydrolipoamide acetyltransferase)
MYVIQVVVPDIGDFKDVPVVEIQIKVGDRIEKDQPLISLESDKALIDIPAPAAGVVHKLDVGLGDKVSSGSLLLMLETAVASSQITPQEPEPEKPPAPAVSLPPQIPLTLAPVVDASQSADPDAVSGIGHAGPAVRKFARETGIDIREVAGTGQRGRVTRADVLSYVKSRMQQPRSSGDGLDLLAWPDIDFSKFGPVTREPLPRIKRISGANLHRNWVHIPHVTNHDDVDVTNLEELRQALNQDSSNKGIKITLLAFIAKASAVALKRFPYFNASLTEGQELVLKNYFHIGFAADTPNGLVVPVVRDVDQKGVQDIASEMSALSALAREGKLKPEQMQGGSFTISSLGGIGGTYFTPIINAPEVGILGVGKARLQPVWDTKSAAVVPRLIMPLSLSWDHRVVDGAEAGRFLAYLKSVLEDFRRVAI